VRGKNFNFCPISCPPICPIPETFLKSNIIQLKLSYPLIFLADQTYPYIKFTICSSSYITSTRCIPKKIKITVSHLHLPRAHLIKIPIFLPIPSQGIYIQADHIMQTNYSISNLLLAVHPT
jgi:hypothetical protein